MESPWTLAVPETKSSTRPEPTVDVVKSKANRTPESGAEAAPPRLSTPLLKDIVASVTLANVSAVAAVTFGDSAVAAMTTVADHPNAAHVRPPFATVPSSITVDARAKNEPPTRDETAPGSFDSAPLLAMAHPFGQAHQAPSHRNEVSWHPPTRLFAAEQHAARARTQALRRVRQRDGNWLCHGGHKQ
jgi:D-alanyl-D-alanine carboxypeptidase